MLPIVCLLSVAQLQASLGLNRHSSWQQSVELGIVHSTEGMKQKVEFACFLLLRSLRNGNMYDTHRAMGGHRRREQDRSKQERLPALTPALACQSQLARSSRPQISGAFVTCTDNHQAMTGLWKQTLIKPLRSSSAPCNLRLTECSLQPYCHSYHERGGFVSALRLSMSQRQHGQAFGCFPSSVKYRSACREGRWEISRYQIFTYLRSKCSYDLL